MAKSPRNRKSSWARNRQARRSYLNRGSSKWKNLLNPSKPKPGDEEKPTRLESWLSRNAWKFDKEKGGDLTSKEALDSWVNRNTSGWRRGPFAPESLKKRNKPRQPPHRSPGPANTNPTDYTGRRKLDPDQAEMTQFEKLMELGPHLNMNVEEFYEASSDLTSEELRQLFYVHGFNYDRKDGSRTPVAVYQSFEERAITAF